jgi:hypothetical protein
MSIRHNLEAANELYQLLLGAISTATFSYRNPKEIQNPNNKSNPKQRFFFYNTESAKHKKHIFNQCLFFDEIFNSNFINYVGYV